MTDLLNRVSNTDCAKLCHRVVDGLCGREPPCRDDYSPTWSLQEWLQLLDFLTALFRLAVGSNISEEEVLTKLSDVNHAEVVLSVLRARQEEIRHALLDRTNSISSATLQDFDWQLKTCWCRPARNRAPHQLDLQIFELPAWFCLGPDRHHNSLALSSDKISSLNTPLLSLSLDVRENGALRPVSMEMSREELSALISSLEAANKVVLQLK